MSAAALAALAREASGHDLVLSRWLGAPRALVWAAWTDPRHLAAWWGPAGFTNPVCTIEPRPGGIWRIDMRAPDGRIYPCRGHYLEVVPPERLVYADLVDPADPAWSGIEPPRSGVQIVTLAEERGGTRLTVTYRHVSAADLAAHRAIGVETGLAESLDRLAALLATLRETRP